VALLDGAVEPGSTWADIGAGTGAFTLALAEFVGPGGRIVAVDRDRDALATTRDSLASRFPDVTLETVVADFRRPLELPLLDGIVAANSLHFVPRSEQAGVIEGLAKALRPGGQFVVVEYDADQGNPWVPHPFSRSTWPALASSAGLVAPRPLGRVRSRFLGAIYSAAAYRS
jgi:ubiquinone/menaquinone biosynthesis C-methylase UbiE